MELILILLYLADIVYTMKIIAVVALLFSTLLSTFLIIRKIATSNFIDEDSIKGGIIKKSILITLILAGVVIITPTPKTVYAITALQAGSIGIDNIKNSELYNKAIELLSKKLDNMLAESADKQLKQKDEQ